MSEQQFYLIAAGVALVFGVAIVGGVCWAFPGVRTWAATMWGRGQTWAAAWWRRRQAAAQERRKEIAMPKWICPNCAVMFARPPVQEIKSTQFSGCANCIAGLGCITVLPFFAVVLLGGIGMFLAAVMSIIGLALIISGLLMPNTKGEKNTYCTHCAAKNLVLLSTPRGKEMFEQYYADSE